MSAPVVHFAGVTHDYVTPGGVTRALDGVELRIESGERVALLGPSGCGKSTLLGIAEGLIAPTAGGAYLDDVKICKPHSDAGVVFQKDLLLNWKTVLDNVLLPVRLRKERVADYRERALALLKDVGLADFADSRPTELSGGMRQRVAFCRALVRDPDVLLLDEPFGALDALTREQINTDLSSMMDTTQATAVLVTHSIEEAAFFADRIVVMSPRPGRIAEEIVVDVPRPRPAWPTVDHRFDEVLDRARRAITSRKAAA
ncbi:ABC transporter ATP-binding protein [Aeromicrobium alkaliterrae]|uniref:ABC transporter ATP-binding protein n=1 Tax=Aeromicrobium alkaliterrae TaxID=302168 RepID=A0ABP4W9Z9_9ACTN